MNVGTRLLIVDDENLEREAVRFFAISLGRFSEIAEANDGPSAVKMAENFRPDVISMDIRIPGFDGIQAAEAIRKFDQRTRFIFLTAFGDLGYARSAFKVGADDFVLKPVSIEAFREAACRALNKLRDFGADYESGVGIAQALSANQRIVSAIRSGLIEEAVHIADQILVARCDESDSVVVSRRAAELMILSVERDLNEDFGRSFGDWAGIISTLRKARDVEEILIAVGETIRVMATGVMILRDDPHKKMIDDIFSFINNHWQESISLDDVGALVGLSRFYVSRIFRAVTGSTFTDYVCSKRIEQAKRLLADPSLPLKRVCGMAGFSDPAYFSNAFKKREGLSPSEFRRISTEKRSAKLLKR